MSYLNVSAKVLVEHGIIQSLQVERLQSTVLLIDLKVNVKLCVCVGVGVYACTCMCTLYVYVYVYVLWEGQRGRRWCVYGRKKYPLSQLLVLVTMWPHNMLLGGVPAHHRVGRLGRATNTLNLRRTCNVVNVSTELP